MTSEILLSELEEITKDNLSRVKNLSQLSEKELNYKSSEQSWSILECIEHLNRYGDYYLPEIERSIKKSKAPNEQEFKSGLLGNYFAKMMLPREKLNKMKTFKSMNPIGSNLDQTVLEKFINQQETLLELLERAKKVSLTKNKTSISISKWIKLKLGDTLRVVIYHNLRHVVQAERVKNEASS